MDIDYPLGKKIIEGSSFKIYGYSILIYGGILTLGIGYALLMYGDEPLAKKIALPSSLALLVIYMSRLVVVRNVPSLRKKALEAKTIDESISAIFGGYVWGLSSFAVFAVFFIALLYHNGINLFS